MFKSRTKELTEGTLKIQVIWLLFHYRTTPTATTGQSPAEVMLRRQLRPCLGFLKPDMGKRVRAHQEQQKKAFDAHSQPRELQPLAQIYAKTLAKGCHGSLGSSRSSRVQCLTLSSWKMVVSFADKWIT